MAIATCVATFRRQTDQQKISSRLSRYLRRWVVGESAEGGTRTPMPVKAQRPERCVSTNFTTSAWLASWRYAQYYCIPCTLSIALRLIFYHFSLCPAAPR